MGWTAAALFAAGLAGCGGPPPRRTPRVPIAVALSERRSVPYEVEATGTVEPLRTADVTAQVGGILTRVDFHEGDEVRAGQPLFQIDPAPLEAALAQASAVLARDRAQYTTARLALVRQEKLAEQDLIAPGDLDQQRATTEALAATVRADSAAMVLARLSRGYATVRAPIPGRSGRLLAHEGDLVKPNDPASALVTLNELRPIRVRFTIPQSELSGVRRHREAAMRVDVLPGERDSVWVQGRLAFVDNAVDNATGTVLLKGEFANRDAALWPGQFVRVRLRVYEQAGVVVVPSAAVTNSQRGTYVYVVLPDTTVESRPVRVERTWRDLSIVSTGLDAGETVVVDGQLRLVPGAKAVLRPAANGGGPGGLGAAGPGAARAGAAAGGGAGTKRGAPPARTR